MSGRIRDKWRPGLSLVLGLTLAVVLCLPLAGIVAVRYLFPVIGYREAVILAGLGVVAMTAVLAYVLTRILLRPITGLVRRAEGARRGEPGALTPLEHYGTVEMKALGQAMLGMGRVLQGREAVLRSYADHVTHELKSPLTAIRGAAELLEAEDLPPPERARLVARIEEAADRMTGLLDAQRALARAQEPLAEGKCRVSELVAGLRQGAPGVEITVEGDAPVPLACDGLRVVLEHLVGNAASHGAARVTIRSARGVLEISDDGPGVTAGNRDRIFDPFFTTQRDRGGTGMGLPIVRRMLQAHGGDIALAETGPGARFVVTF